MTSDIKKVIYKLENYKWPNEQEYLKKSQQFTLLLPIYLKDNTEYFGLAVNSVLSNSVTPTEILIMQDGPVNSSLNSFLSNLISQYPNVIRIIKNSKNKGLGPNLAKGVQLAKNQLIARMDADDIAYENRFEVQLERFNQNSKLNIVGGNIVEFDNSYQLTSVRNVPTAHKDICEFAKMRSPFNHPAVMFQKSAILDVGNYNSIKFLEDYDLFVRLIQSHKICENIPQNLVYMRAPDDMYMRRGGNLYFKRYFSFRKKLLKEKFISNKDFIVSVIGMFFTSFSPVIFRKMVYNLLLRQKNISSDA